jgi:ATP-dependent protease HslVU (ClpYQ) ATPase subunit
MSKDACLIAKVPCIIVPLTSYTQTGYVGDSVGDIIKDFVNAIDVEMTTAHKRFKEVGNKTISTDYDNIEAVFLMYTDNTIDTALAEIKSNLKLVRKYMYAKAFKTRFGGKKKQSVPESLMVPEDFAKEHSKLLSFDAKTMRFKNNREWIDSAVEYISQSMSHPRAWAIDDKYGKTFHPTLLVHAYATCYRGRKHPPSYELEAYVLAYSMSLLKLALDTFENRYYETLEYKANHGVIVLDEFDKIANTGDRDNVGRSGLQRDLLILLGGTEYNVTLNQKEFKSNAQAEVTKDPREKDPFSFINVFAGPGVKVERRIVSVNTKGICFIGAGAFESEDLNGIISELVGRFGIITRTETLTLEDITGIIPAVLNELNDEYRDMSVCFTITDDAVQELAVQIVRANRVVNTGARRVKSLLTSTILPWMSTIFYYPDPGRLLSYEISVAAVTAALEEWKRTQMFQETKIGFAG